MRESCGFIEDLEENFLEGDGREGGGGRVFKDFAYSRVLGKGQVLSEAAPSLLRRVSVRVFYHCRERKRRQLRKNGNGDIIREKEETNPVTFGMDNGCNYVVL